NNSLAPNLERGNSNFDIRRRFSWNFGYEFPKMGGSWSKLKNGWGINGVLNIQDGQPYQMNYNFEGDYSGSVGRFDSSDVVDTNDIVVPCDPAAGRGIGFLPLTATGDVGIGNPFLGGGGPRGVQFSVKLTF